MLYCSIKWRLWNNVCCVHTVYEIRRSRNNTLVFYYQLFKGVVQQSVITFLTFFWKLILIVTGGHVGVETTTKTFDTEPPIEHN